MRDPQNIREIGNLAPDYMGFIFYPPSPRYAGELDLGALRDLPDTIQKVGVFVDADYDEMRESIERYRLTAVQLHGHETPELCERIRPYGQVIKAFGVAEKSDLKQVVHYEKSCDLFLFDTRTVAYGGSGRRFDWRVLEEYHGQLPFLISGGIGPEDVERVRDMKHPKCVGVDLNSRFEITPGYKNMELIDKFIKSIR